MWSLESSPIDDFFLFPWFVYSVLCILSTCPYSRTILPLSPLPPPILHWRLSLHISHCVLINSLCPPPQPPFGSYRYVQYFSFSFIFSCEDSAFALWIDEVGGWGMWAAGPSWVPGHELVLRNPSRGLGRTYLSKQTDPRFLGMVKWTLTIGGGVSPSRVLGVWLNRCNKF